MTDQPRWHARITYRMDDGEAVRFFTFEELSELEPIVEAGPDWNTIIKVEVVLARVSNPGLTVEQAATL